MYKIRYWLPFLAVWVGLCILLFLSIYDAAKTRTIDELNARQRIHARQAASGIEFFFRHWAAQLALISEKDGLRDFDNRGRETMNAVFDSNRDDITALTRVDARGTILYTIPEVAGVIGRDISDQKHIQRILKTHQPVISDVFHTVQGYDAVVLHVPVFSAGRFDGTVAALIDFKTISKRYLENIRIGASGYAWMLSADGIELFCPVPGHVGRHVFDNCKDFPTIVAMAREMLAGKTGTATYLYDRVREDQIESVTKHAVYMPARILDSFWAIAVASSEAEVLSGLERFKDKLFVVIGLILFGTIVFTFLGLKASHVLQEDEKRNLAEEALEKSEQRYRDIVEGTDNLVTEVDMAGRFIFVNEAAQKIFGLKPQECLGRRAFDFVHADDREETLRHFNRWIEEKKPGKAFENRQVSRTGEIRDMLWTIGFVFDDAGNIVSIKSIARDITERKRAEKALRESERRLAEAQKLAKVGHYIFDIKGGYWTNSDQLDEIFGIDGAFEKDVAGWLRIVHPDDRAMMEDYLQCRVLDQHHRFDKEYRIVNVKTGREKWVHGLGDLEYDGHNNPVEMFGTIQDITDRKRAEQALKRSEDYLFSVFRAVPTGIVILKSRIFTMVNDRISEITGYSREELLGRTTRILYPNDEEYDDAGRKIYEHIYARDFVSGEYRFQEELEAARDAAESANRAKSEFLANMSHEIRTPMNAVVGMSELLLTTPLTPKQKNYAEAVADASIALLAILDDILDLSKIQAGKLSLEKVPFDLREIVEQVGQILALRAQDKQIEVLVRYPLDIPSRYAGDPTRIRQILMNLAGNAVKFTDAGHVLLDLTMEGREADRCSLFFSVSDTGIGIPAEQLETLFEQFSQADESTTRRYGGTGLGLAISKRLVEMMGGSIQARSMVGQGSVFSFNLSLPCSHEPETGIALDMDLSGVRVLVVDDNPRNREITLEYLQLRSVPSEAADSAEMALDLLRRENDRGRPFDMAVLDHRMPGMDGGQLALAIKKDSRLEDTVLILLSSFIPIDELAPEIRECFAGGLNKPIKVSVFFETLMAAWSAHLSGTMRPVPSPSSPPLAFEPLFPEARVLLVEDSPMNQQVAMEILKRFGCRVDVAANGSEAVNRFRAGAYDLIFMDIHMPLMDGFEATRMIRNSESGNHRIPIVAMTALAMQGDREKCLQTGMDEYIAKPIRSAAVKAFLARPLTPENAPIGEAGDVGKDVPPDGG